jgi:DNA-binding response OmpR family regulator
MKKPFSRDEVFARIEMLAQRESGVPVQERIVYTGQHRRL